jgi:hypothetical protein
MRACLEVEALVEASDYSERQLSIVTLTRSNVAIPMEWINIP